MKLVRTTIIVIASFLATAGVAGAVGVFYFQPIDNNFVINANLTVNHPGVLKAKISGLESSNSNNPLYIDAYQDAQIRVDQDCADAKGGDPTSTATLLCENNKEFRINNGNNDTVFVVKEDGKVVAQTWDADASPLLTLQAGQTATPNDFIEFFGGKSSNRNPFISWKRGTLKIGSAVSGSMSIADNGNVTFSNDLDVNGNTLTFGSEDAKFLYDAAGVVSLLDSVGTLRPLSVNNLLVSDDPADRTNGLVPADGAYIKGGLKLGGKIDALAVAITTPDFANGWRKVLVMNQGSLIQWPNDTTDNKSYGFGHTNGGFYWAQNSTDSSGGSLTNPYPMELSNAGDLRVYGSVFANGVELSGRQIYWRDIVDTIPINVRNSLTNRTDDQTNHTQNTDEDGGVPSGFCVFSSSDTSCPPHFIKNSKLNERILRATSNGTRNQGGDDSGDSSHTHVINHGARQETDDMTGYEYNATVMSSEYNIPPYQEAIICCNNEGDTPYVP